MLNDQEREKIAVELERHADEEDEILSEYHSLSDLLPEGPLGILINHIVTEEEMHHFLLRTLAGWLRTAPKLDELEIEEGVDVEEILRRTRLLQDHERQTIDACEKLKSKFEGEEEAIFNILLEAIGVDSEKHRRLLTVVESVLGG